LLPSEGPRGTEIYASLNEQDQYTQKKTLQKKTRHAATVKIGSFMCGGMENADRSKEVWPRTERILYFQVFQNLKDAACRIHAIKKNNKKVIVKDQRTKRGEACLL
jgi:hypothetical protein